MKKTIGQVTIRINNTKSRESKKIKELREQKRNAKKSFNEAIKNNKNRVPVALEIYIKAQKELRDELAEENRKNVKEKLEKMSKEG